jgi:hypothetical protein
VPRRWEPRGGETGEGPMRTGIGKGAALGMAAVVVAMLLSGCGGGGTGEEGRTGRALKAILKEYGPRFEQRRTALAAAASRLSEFSLRGLV